MKTLTLLLSLILITLIFIAWPQGEPQTRPLEILYVENSDEMGDLPDELYIVIKQDSIATGYLLNTHTNQLTEVQFYQD